MEVKEIALFGNYCKQKQKRQYIAHTTVNKEDNISNGGDIGTGSVRMLGAKNEGQ